MNNLSESKEQSAVKKSGLPPVFKTWNQLYAFVIVLHVILIFVFYFITVSYS